MFTEQLLKLGVLLRERNFSVLPIRTSLFKSVIKRFQIQVVRIQEGKRFELVGDNVLSYGKYVGVNNKSLWIRLQIHRDQGVVSSSQIKYKQF